MNQPAPPVPVHLAHLPTVAGLVVPYVTPRTSDGRFLFGVQGCRPAVEQVPHASTLVVGAP